MKVNCCKIGEMYLRGYSLSSRVSQCPLNAHLPFGAPLLGQVACSGSLTCLAKPPLRILQGNWW